MIRSALKLGSAGAFVGGVVLAANKLYPTPTIIEKSPAEKKASDAFDNLRATFAKRVEAMITPSECPETKGHAGQPPSSQPTLPAAQNDSAPKKSEQQHDYIPILLVSAALVCAFGGSTCLTPLLLGSAAYKVGINTYNYYSDPKK